MQPRGWKLVAYLDALGEGWHLATNLSPTAIPISGKLFGQNRHKAALAGECAAPFD